MVNWESSRREFFRLPIVAVLVTATIGFMGALAPAFADDPLPSWTRVLRNRPSLRL